MPQILLNDCRRFDLIQGLKHGTIASAIVGSAALAAYGITLGLNALAHHASQAIGSAFAIGFKALIA